MNSIDKIDFVLQEIYNNKTLYIKDLLELAKAKQISYEDIRAIIRKLIDEKYIIESSNAIYHISFDGGIFVELGGYRQQLLNDSAQSTRLGKLEKNQILNQSALTWLTAIVAFGTLVSAVYYIWEMVILYQQKP